MAVTTLDLNYYASLNNPADDTSTLGGGIDTSVELTGASVGEIFNQKGANALAGADKTTYAKMHVKNENASDDLSSAVLYLENHLATPAADGTFTIVSSSASDGSAVYVKLYFMLAAGTYTTEDVVLNGTTPVSSTAQAKLGKCVKAELRAVVGDALTPAVGDISITRGVLLGKIPIGYYSASGNYSIGVAATLDDTATTTDRLTAPAGITFYQPNTFSAGVAIVNGGVLTHETSQGIWIKQILYNGETPTADIEIGLVIEGETL